MDCKSCNKEECPAKHKKPEEQLEEFIERQELTKRLCQIKHKILVLSGKGGVGKSTVAVNMATALSSEGFNVGLLDVDIHGPSVPVMLNLQNAKLMQGPDGVLPIKVGPHLKVISIAFFLEHPEQAVIWRGPMKMGVIKQFIKDVDWGELDYLIIDSPPGTGDEPLSVVQLIDDLDGGVLVTTPQEVSSSDVKRSITFCNKINLPVLGVVENMSGFRCPDCGKVTPIFSQGGGRKMAEDMNVPFLGSVPIDPAVATGGDEGTPFVTRFAESETAKEFNKIIQPIMALSTDQ
jgi:Mrp family chromosome partitioning ATPase